MRSDESGVAGFFEDLPVLAFVLCGVMLLVSSGIWASARIAEQREDELLKRLAERAADAIVETIAPAATDFELPTLQSIDRSNLSEYIQSVLQTVHFLVNLSTEGTASGWSMLISDSYGGEVSHTASASRLLNVRDGFGLIVVLEVRLIVWDD